MKIKYLIIVFVLFFYCAYVNGQSLQFYPISPKVSYDQMVTLYKVSFKGKNLSTESIFHYSLNNGALKSIKPEFDSIEDKLTLTIDTLVLEKEYNQLLIRYNRSQDYGPITIRYIKPVFKETRVSQNKIPVNQFNPDNKIYVVQKSDSVLIEYKYTEEDVTQKIGTKGIKKFQYMLGNNKAWKDLKFDRISVSAKISTGLLNPGANIFNFRAECYENSTGDPYPEYTDTETVCIFYINFQLPDSLKNGICRTNKNYSLKGSGLPIDGGFFYGSGIVGNSNEFNPEYGHIGDNEIEYRYLYYGNLISSSPQKVTVNTIPEFTISGKQIVCKNSTDQVYEILPCDKKNMYIWSVDGGKKLEQSACSATIQWDSKVPSGKVIVYAYIDNSDASCYNEMELIVHVKDEFATKKSYPVFIDSERKLLACTDATAKSYRWIKKMGNTETILDTTNKPYFVNKAGAQPGEIYYVETADDILSCYSRSYPCDFNNNWNSNKAAYIATNIPDKITEENIRLSMDGDAVQILSKTDLVLTLSLVDISGRNVYQGQFKNLAKLNRSMFAPGPYIITVKSDTNFLFRSLIRL